MAEVNEELRRIKMCDCKTECCNHKQEPKPMFADAKVGDKVWSPIGGWGVVDEIRTNEWYCIVVNFPGVIKERFTDNGHIYKSSPGPSLFWDEVPITPPTRPKRIVKRSEQIVANVYQRPHGGLTIRDRSFFFHESRGVAESRVVGKDERIATAKVTIEWEEEE